MYSDADVAALYEVLNPWGPSDDFYLSSVMAAESALDVGCGTGGLLVRAREDGHRGRLAGIDPDRASLERARAKKLDADLVLGKAADLTWENQFEVAVLASNTFQFLVEDDDLRTSLARIHAALVPGGRLIFGTRNPADRAWKDWNPANAYDVVDHAGRELRMIYHVRSVVGDVITLTETTADRDGTPLRVDPGTMRFLSPDRIHTFLTEAGFTLDHLYGTWTRTPFTPHDENIIVTAHRP